MNNTEFVYVTYIKTSPEKLWKALTTTEFTRQYWFGTHMVSDWKEGASISLEQADGTKNVVGHILKYKPFTELSYTFKSTDVPDETPSRVHFNLDQDGDLVELTVRHDQLDPAGETIKRISGGWPAVLSSLKSLLELGHALNYDASPCGD